MVNSETSVKFTNIYETLWFYGARHQGRLFLIRAEFFENSALCISMVNSDVSVNFKNIYEIIWIYGARR